MKKLLTLSVLVSMFISGTALADILPEGTKTVPVCAYFNNTADFLDDISIYGYETAPGGEKVDFSQFIANECFTKSYKFNTYGVYAVTVEHADTLDLETYDPTTDEEAYPTNISPEIGELTVDDTSNIESVSNEYTIIELDLEEGVLVIEPVLTTTYYNDETEPLITEGEVKSLSEEEISVEDAFTDVGANDTYYTAVKYLKDEGIIGGYADGSYKPESPINRAEFTKIIMGAVAEADAIAACNDNYVEEGNYMVTLFTDVTFEMVGGNEPVWYYDYVCMAKLNGVIGGYPDGSFKPAQDINFVEASKIVTEAMGYQMMTDTDPWYMGYVMELENHNAIPTSITGFDHKITRGEMAEMIYRLRAEVTNLPSLTYEGLE